jgi:hypothetical protein
MSKRPTHALVIALSFLVCCGQNGSSAGCNPPPAPPPGPNVAAIAGGIAAGAAATAVILISVDHAHHNLKGCVFESPGGLQLRTEDKKDYELTGSTKNLAVGNRVHLKGDRQKHDKGTEQIFLVKELKKSYGPCSVLNASAPSTGAPQKPAPANSASSETQP